MEPFPSGSYFFDMVANVSVSYIVVMILRGENNSKELSY